MTQRIIISILFLVTVSLGSNTASAGSFNQKHEVENHGKGMKSAMTEDAHTASKNMPVSQAPKPDAPHSKAPHAPQVDEVPHVHKYHKERVKKIKKHHSKLWFLGQALVVLCQLSLLFIAYMHIIH
jgi:hypothetical protein